MNRKLSAFLIGSLYTMLVLTYPAYNLYAGWAGSGGLNANSVEESHLKAVDSPADEQCLTYESTVGDFEWQVCGGGSGTMTSIEENNSQIGGSDIVTLDFGNGIDCSEAPDTEINCLVDEAELTIETMITAGAAGTVPLSDGATGIDMTDVLQPAELNSESELETLVADMANIIQAAEIDTESEFETIVAGLNFLTSVEVNSEAKVEALFGVSLFTSASTGDVTITGDTTTIGADKILESMLKAVDAAADEECLTYESTTGDFEWQTCGAGSGNVSDNTAEAITGVWEIQDDTLFNFGNDADFGVRYDETTDDQLEVISNSASTTDINITNEGAGETDLFVDGNVTADAYNSTLVSGDIGYHRFPEDPDNGTNYMAWQAPSSVTANISLILPDGDGSANEVLKTNGSAVMAWDTPLWPDDASFDFGAADHEIPNGTGGTTDTTGQVYLDTNGDTTNITDPMVQLYDGSANKYLLPIALPLAASQDNFVITYNAAGKTVQWEAAPGVGSGDDVSVDGAGVVNPDLLSTGDIDVVDTANDVTFNINEDKVDPAHMADGDHGAFTYTTNVAALDANTVDSAVYVDASIDPEHLADNTYGVLTNSKAAGYTVGADDSQESYGGVIYVTSAATIQLPDVVARMKITIITIGATAVSVDTDAGDDMTLDGTDLDNGDKATNTSTTGDILVCIYMDADSWYCASGSNAGTQWSDGGA